MCYLPQNWKGSQSSLRIPTGPTGLPSSLLLLLVLASTLFRGLWVVGLLSDSDSPCSLPVHPSPSLQGISISLCLLPLRKQLFPCRTLSPGFPSGSHSGLQRFGCQTLSPRFCSGSRFHSGGLGGFHCETLSVLASAVVVYSVLTSPLAPASSMVAYSILAVRLSLLSSLWWPTAFRLSDSLSSLPLWWPTAFRLSDSLSLLPLPLWWCFHFPSGGLQCLQRFGCETLSARVISTFGLQRTIGTRSTERTVGCQQQGQDTGNFRKLKLIEIK